MLLSITEFTGRFHPLLVHLPIGIMLVALLLQWLSRRQQYALSDGVLRVLWLSGAATALLSCITGYLLSLSGEYDERTVNLHMWMAVSTTLLAVFICVCVFRRRFDKLYHGALVLLLLLIAITGHLGGSLTHGSDYLTAALSDSGKADKPGKVIANIQEAQVYADVVEPMLQSKCYGCHGRNKQKGGLRMDSPEWLMKGGKEGRVIRSGKAGQSELIKRLLLAREEEHHMPPKEKPQLSERQVALLHWWVEQGADFSKKVKELPQPEKVKTVLLSMQGSEKKPDPAVPETPVEAADEKAVEQLRNRGAIVLPVAQNSHYLMVNFVTATGITDTDIRLLLPLGKQLVWLKAGGTRIGDPALQSISQCTNLTRLQLNGTQITDKSLPLLRSLSRLQSLNLVGTNISTQGLLPLRTLKKLQSIYLYQTRIQPGAWPQLKQAFPHVQLDTGGYVVPFFVTDTTLKQAEEQKKP